MRKQVSLAITLYLRRLVLVRLRRYCRRIPGRELLSQSLPPLILPWTSYLLLGFLAELHHVHGAQRSQDPVETRCHGHLYWQQKAVGSAVVCGEQSCRSSQVSYREGQIRLNPRFPTRRAQIVYNIFCRLEEQAHTDRGGPRFPSVLRKTPPSKPELPCLSLYLPIPLTATRGPNQRLISSQMPERM